MVSGTKVQCAAAADFDWVLKFLSKSPVQFTSTGSALSALVAAHKFLCCGLAAQAGHYIVSRLSVNNVLSVLQEVSLHCPKDSGLAPVCSVPPSRASSSGSGDDGDQGDNTQCCSALLKACHKFVDLHAADILVSEGWLAADVCVVRSVLCRSSLHITSELTAASALSAWSSAACSQLNLPQSPENLRTLAAGCQYLVRYLTLTPDEFRNGPMGSGLLTEEESDSILFELLRPGSSLPDHLAPLRRVMSQSRRSQSTQELSSDGKGSQSDLDIKINRLQELREKEKALKESYSIVDDLFMCLRCLLD